MTRHDPAEAGPTGSVGTQTEHTPGGYQASPVRGSYVHLGPDLEAVAAELVERLGDRVSYRLADAVITAADSIQQKRRVDPEQVRRNREHVQAIQAELRDRSRNAPPPPWPSVEVVR
ncbi:MAG: hypothetical protein IPG97_15450 [Microthrixaceae bacterium]|jgi:hypothetical protein|nr:hypothetical protein [Microthrixaceae bacterium]